MIQVRKSEERGHFDHGWLNTYHTFSFSEYYDPKHMSFRHLRVINEDFVAPADGFDTHPHENMEIITYIVEGELEHKDSMGNGSVIRPGDVQRMSAGTGVTHSEFNPSKSGRVHLLQIWIFPEKKGIKPSYEQKHFAPESRVNQLRLVASRDGAEGSVTIHQDAKVFVSTLESGRQLEHSVGKGRAVWVQLIRGELDLNGTELHTGDGAAVTDESAVSLRASKESEFILFDLN
jgi:redox-sensitive bicupin YhaK (pirin superfamily)